MANTQENADLLVVRELSVDGPRGEPLLRDISFELAAGQALALVGPSGCGKSLTARALLGLLPPGFHQRGLVQWQGAGVPPENRAAIRGHGLGLMLQEPSTSLNPVLTVGAQIAETWRVHRGGDRASAWRAAVQLLDETQVPRPSQTAGQYPHELSGGMRQRALLAATLAGDPQLLIADEPTTALDVLVQREILALIARIRSERGMALLFITHDLNLVPLVAEGAVFMANGRLKGMVPAADLRFPPPTPRAETQSPNPEPVLAARDIWAGHHGQQRPAVAGVDLILMSGRATGLLGESGCGKTTLGRVLSLQMRPQTGTLTLTGADCLAAGGAAARSLRRRSQMLFQDPGGSLDPRQRVADALGEAAGAEGHDPARLLAEVGLEPSLGTRYPHELSGGQRQRVALARCLATAPAVLVADEPTSALDAEARDHVLALLAGVMRKRGLALLLISHDLEVLQSACQEIHVMYGGVIVEVLPGGAEFAPRHPYTLELVAAVPRALRRVPSSPPAQPISSAAPLATSATGCPRYGSCSLEKPSCGKELPPLKKIGDRHYLRCPEAEDCDSSQFIDTI